MKIIFYSNNCEYCKKLLNYLEKNNIQNIFKLINIDTTDVPENIDIVPTIIDTELNQPLKGKKAFEYLINIKYFNNPTNNIDYIKELPPNPDIKEDDKAIKSKTLNLKIENESLNFHEENKNKNITSVTNTMNESRQIQDKKLSVLLQMRRR